MTGLEFLVAIGLICYLMDSSDKKRADAERRSAEFLEKNPEYRAVFAARPLPRRKGPLRRGFAAMRQYLREEGRFDTGPSILPPKPPNGES